VRQHPCGTSFFEIGLPCKHGLNLARTYGLTEGFAMGYGTLFYGHGNPWILGM